MENRGRCDFRFIDGADSSRSNQHGYARSPSDGAVLSGHSILQMAQQACQSVSSCRSTIAGDLYLRRPYGRYVGQYLSSQSRNEGIDIEQVNCTVAIHVGSWNKLR